MEVLDTKLDGPLLLAPAVFGDERGFFAETFRAEALAALGVTEPFVQDNHSRSAYGVIRGLHFQIGAGASKLVRCGRGAIADVLVDIRRDSETFAQHEFYELSDENMHVLYAPIGFAHGFCVLSETADVLYKQSNYYSGDVERGIKLDDPALGIGWPISPADRIISARDRAAPTLAEFDSLASLGARSA